MQREKKLALEDLNVQSFIINGDGVKGGNTTEGGELATVTWANVICCECPSFSVEQHNC